MGPEKGGSALTAEVLLAGFNLNVDRVFDAPDAAIKKLGTGDLDALIFIGGAPVPAFRNLDKTFHFVAFPPNSGLEQIYIKKKIEKSVYPWADDFETYAVDVERPGASQAEATRVMGTFLRDVVRLNAESRNFRLMGPDETSSNRLDNVFEAT